MLSRRAARVYAFAGIETRLVRGQSVSVYSVSQLDEVQIPG